MIVMTLFIELRRYFKIVNNYLLSIVCTVLVKGEISGLQLLQL